MTVKKSDIHLLGMAGMGRNVGFGANKVFSAALLQVLSVSQPVIGFVLGLEGLMGLVLNPLTGWISDRTHRNGFRRKVYSLIGLPAAALTWLIFIYTHSSVVAIIALGFFYVFQQASVSPYQAWTPELVPQEWWGYASGYLNLWWQVGNLLAFLTIPLVWGVWHTGAYWLTAILIAGGGLVTGLMVPEKPAAKSGATHAKLSAYLPLVRGSLLLFFLSQAFAWMAFEAIASFFTLYILQTIHGSLLDSALIMSLFTITGMIAAVIAGSLYHRYSQKLLLSLSLGFFGLLALLGLFVHNLLAVFVLVGIEGVFWAANLTVAYAYAKDLLKKELDDEALEAQLHGGLYGMSNVVQSLGLLIAAPVTGLVIHATSGDYRGMFLVSAASSWLAVGMVRLVHD